MLLAQQLVFETDYFRFSVLYLFRTTSIEWGELLELDALDVPSLSSHSKSVEGLEVPIQEFRLFPMYFFVDCKNVLTESLYIRSHFMDGSIPIIKDHH